MPYDRQQCTPLAEALTAPAAGEAAELATLRDTDHMAFLDPGSEACGALMGAVDALLPSIWP